MTDEEEKIRINLIPLISILDGLKDCEREILFTYYCTFCGKIKNRKPNDYCNCMRDD